MILINNIPVVLGEKSPIYLIIVRICNINDVYKSELSNGEYFDFANV